jgi:putative peptidoglycan lipid II flippase
MAPVLFGQAASEVNKLVDSVFAILLGEGTVTVLFYANRLIQLPLSMFGFATAAAILPAASSAASRQNTDEIRAALMFGLRQTFFLVFPSLLGLIVLGEPIIRVLFQGAHFGPDTVARTASALTLYAFGLLSFSWVKVAVAGFYAVQDTRTPVIAASVSMLLNILLNCALVSPLGYQGLALATSISFTVNFVWLYILLCNRFGTLWSAAFAGGLLRMAIAGLMMAAVTYAAYARLYHEFPGDALTEQLIVAGAPLIIGAAAYFGFCAALGVPELSLTLQMLRRGRSQRGKKT